MLRRHVLKIACTGITLFWLAMMGLLVYREAFVPRIKAGDLAASTYRDEPSEQWLGVYLAERRIGYVNLRSYPVVQGGVSGTSMSMTANLAIDVLQQGGDMDMRGSAWIARDTGLRDISFQMTSAGQRISLRGEVVKGVLKGAVEMAGETMPVEWPVGKDVMLWNNMGVSALSMPVIEVGEEYVVSMVDPLTLSAGDARIRCVAESAMEFEGESITVREMTIDMNGNESRAWVNLEGEVQRIETGMGLTLQRTTADALFAEKNADTGDITPNEIMAIHPSGKTPFEGARRMRVRLSGHRLDQEIPRDTTQTIKDDGLEIIVPDAMDFGGASVNPKLYEAYLSPGAFIQSNDPAIREQARAIVGKESDSWKQVSLLYTWVFENIDKIPALSIPSATEVLASRRGDCNEHTVLFTALARSLGIPTRIAIGLMWGEDGKCFYYHAWPEVFMDKWIWVDPTYGQLIADATHIKLLNGDIEAWPRLIGFVGGLKIEVLEVE
ncbi:MAG: hypothetical protein AMXMBFR84_21790 [Candidatus Hydrogenedentota bacterium]